MKFVIERDSIKMIPENNQDRAYIEDTLGLRNANDWIPFRRIPVLNLPSAIAYIEAKKP